MAYSATAQVKTPRASECKLHRHQRANVSKQLPRPNSIILRRIAVILLVVTCIGLGWLGYFQSRNAPAGAAELSLRQLLGLPGGNQPRDIEGALPAVARILFEYRPTPTPSQQRLSALAVLDSILHIDNAPELLPVQRFFHRQIEQAVQQIKHTDVSSGASVWLVYNHGFIVRTAAATLCFDLVRAKYLPGFALSQDLMTELVEQCDVLFVSHAHADHAETFVAQTMIDLGKPVVAPSQVAYREPLNASITHLEPRAHAVQTLPIKGKPVSLRIVIYPGHQGDDIDNNVVLVIMPDGITVSHTGDQWDKGADFEWIDDVSKHFKVDILLPNDWTYDIARMVRGFNPALVIPGHANELGHSLDKRQSYAFSFERKLGSSRFGGNEDVGYAAPLVVMTWGESFHYEPRPDVEQTHTR